MILNDLEESDTEFWADFSEVPHSPSYLKVSIPLKEAQQSNKFLSFNSNSPLKTPGITSVLWTREFFEDKLNRARESNELQIEKSTIKAKNEVRRLYSDKLEILRHKYVTDFRVLMKEFNDLKDVLNIKDEYIHILTEVLVESQMTVTETMMKLASKKKRNEVDAMKDAENWALAEEVRNLKEQIVNLKELCVIYQKDTDKAVGALEELEKVYDCFKKDTEKKVKMIQDALDSKEKVIEKLNSTRLFEIEKLKDNFKKEAMIREELQIRQQAYIEQLQDELKNAKNVLQNKYLRNQYYKTLKEYKEEADKCSKVYTTVISTPHNRAQSAVKRKKRNNSVIFDSFISEKPIVHKRNVKVTKPIFTGILQGSIFNTWSE